MIKCCECNDSKNLGSIIIYKRKWFMCNKCGAAFSAERAIYPLSMLPFPHLKKSKDLNEDNIYDYFASKEHEKVSRINYELFMRNFSSYINNLEHKNILDISGGSGHFLKNFKPFCNYALMTEINTKAVNFANDDLKLNAVRFDFNKDSLAKVFNENKIRQKFDYVFMVACSMFCLDMSKLISELKPYLNDNAVVILSGNVAPTIGVMIRTQFDDYSYLVLRQKEALKKYFQKDFSLLRESWYQDEYTEYVLAHDVGLLNSILKNFYAIKAVRKILKQFPNTAFSSFRLRDRHLYYQVFQYNK